MNKPQRHAGAKALPKRIVWCLPCGVEGRAEPASTTVDGDPACSGCALAASMARTRELAEMQAADVDTPATSPGATRMSATASASDDDDPLPLFELEARIEYCRWSSDDWRSDVYCYRIAAGFMTQVGAGRVAGEVPRVTAQVRGDPEAFLAQHQAQLNYMLGASWEDISLPYAGDSFLDPTLGEFRARLHELRALGYRVPASVLARVDLEVDAERARKEAA